MDKAEYNPTERLFDRYCDAMGYKSLLIPPATAPTADRMVETPDGRMVVEVEGYGFSRADRALEAEIIGRGGHKVMLGLLGRERLNDAFKRARRQLAQPEYEGLPRVLMIGRHPYVDTGPFAIQAIMYGDPYISLPIGPEGPEGEPESRFPMRGRLRHPGGPISAVAVIDEVCPDAVTFGRLLHDENERVKREQGELERPAAIVRLLELSERIRRAHPELDLEEQVPCLQVHENVYAAAVLPRTIFWGRYDRRWGPIGEQYREIVRS